VAEPNSENSRFPSESAFRPLHCFGDLSDWCLSLSTQYWTCRGIGVLDVNYRGSTGYGRHYRLRLEKQWGLVDVEDCVAGARWLVANRTPTPSGV
jgi:hypothetical protein